MIFLLALTLARVSQADEFEFFSATSQESDINFTAELMLIQKSAPTKAQIDAGVRNQMRFMLGIMHSREKTAAALYPKWSFTTLETKKNADGTGYVVKYDLKSKGLFKNGTTEYTFTLPYNPNTIFRASEGKCMAKEAVESNFWYHWEPLTPGCPLKENEHYYNLKGRLTARASTTQTYPEYSRLVDADKTIKVTMFFGLADYDFQNWTPEGGDDWGIRSYNQYREFLKSKGFTEVTWTRQQVETVYKAKDGKFPYVIDATWNGPFAKIRVRMILANTGFNHNSLGFHYFLKEALAKESVIIYDGHSGIGQNMDIPSIERLRGFKMPINMNYQILFLGSCLPYAYYPEIFFNKKRSATDPTGTKNLDIFTYGQESLFGSKEDQLVMRALIRYATDGGRVSYQTIVKLGPEFFFAINGDEDNPTK